MKTIRKILNKELRINLIPLVYVGLLMMSTVVLDLIAPWPFKILIDNVLTMDAPPTTGFISFLHTYFPTRDLLGFLAVFIYFSSSFTLAIVEYLRSISTKRIVRGVTARFSKAAFANLQTIMIGFYDKQQIGDYIYRLGYDVSALGEFLEEGLLPLITSTLYLIAAIVVMSLISVKLTILSLAALPFLAYGLYAFNQRVDHATKRSEYWSSATYAFIEEALNHLKIIQAFSQEKHESQKFDSRVDMSLSKENDMYQVDFLLSLLVGIVIALSYSVVIIYGINAVFSGELTAGLLIVFIFYLDNLTTPILGIIYAATAARTAYTKIIRMEDFFSAKSHTDYHHGTVKKMGGGDIRFEHVSYISTDNKKILDNVSFTIEEGKRTIIFGGNGSGKTSVANLILRFIDAPTLGRIRIGAVPLEKYDLEVLRESIAYVPQEITLFSDTILSNIVFGNRHHTFEQVKRAAHLADADTFIEKLPKRYHFKVGEGGGFLSGGQRQRIMLARALLKRESPILIFDETFSALDVKTRRKVLDNVYDFSRGKTAIIISNIFDVITAADNIIVLSQGKLLYSGPAKRLPKEISLYNMIMESEPTMVE